MIGKHTQLVQGIGVTILNKLVIVNVAVMIHMENINNMNNQKSKCDYCEEDGFIGDGRVPCPKCSDPYIYYNGELEGEGEEG
jgi:hypothetical protein